MPLHIVRRLGIWLRESLPDRGGDHGVLAFWHVRDRIAHPVRPASLPARAEDAGDRRAQTLMSIGDDQLDALRPAPDQALDEARPKRFGLGRANPETDDLAPPFGRYGDRNYLY